MSKPIVFIVDDEPVIAQILAITLNQSGFAAFSFEDPRRAIEAARAIKPDVLISDVIMPGMTGVQLAICFQSVQPECKILLLSGQADTIDLMNEAREKGYNFDLMSKPVHPTYLLARLRV